VWVSAVVGVSRLLVLSEVSGFLIPLEVLGEIEWLGLLFVFEVVGVYKD
jgi:hypothetical protein